MSFFVIKTLCEIMQVQMPIDVFVCERAFSYLFVL